MSNELTAGIDATDLADWAGLDPELTLAELGLNEANPSGQGRLGTPPTTTRWWGLANSATRYRNGLRAWAVDGGVIMVQGDLPLDPAGDPVLIPDLGPPAHEGPAYLAGLRLEGGFRAYPDRGMAVAVNPDNRIVVTVWLFAPTTVEDFVARLEPQFGPEVLT